MEHTKVQPRHVAEADKPPALTAVQRLLLRILEISTMELIIGILHLAVTTLAVFGLIGAAGGGGH